jgi:hypothetical protein
MKPPFAPDWSFPTRVIDLAASLLPADRADWAAAMKAELQCASDRRSALLWALGCLRVGLSAKLSGRPLLDIRALRWALTGWLAYRTQDCLCDVALVLSYKAPWLGLKGLLGECAQGEDYQLLIPLLNATTYWSLGAWLLVCALQGWVIICLLRRTSYAAYLFGLAASLNVALWIVELSEPLFVQAFSQAELLRDAFMYGGTALLGGFCWVSMRNRSPLAL